jgi:hypothetical protein
MVFMADAIPNELRRIVEFLNQQMEPAEVLAIEVRQFVGDGVKTFIPRVFGQTEAARIKKASGSIASKAWDEDSFLASVQEAKGVQAASVAKELIEWIRPQVTRLWWGSGSKEGGIVPLIESKEQKFHLCRLATPGRIVFCFDWLCQKPPFEDERLRRELLQKINQIPGAQFADDKLTKRAKIQFEKLTSPAAMEALKSALKWEIDMLSTAIAKQA